MYLFFLNEPAGELPATLKRRNARTGTVQPHERITSTNTKRKRKKDLHWEVPIKTANGGGSQY
jgi:hypothetical protein